MLGGARLSPLGVSFEPPCGAVEPSTGVGSTLWSAPPRAGAQTHLSGGNHRHSHTHRRWRAARYPQRPCWQQVARRAKARWTPCWQLSSRHALMRPPNPGNGWWQSLREGLPSSLMRYTFGKNASCHHVASSGRGCDGSGWTAPCSSPCPSLAHDTLLVMVGPVVPRARA